MALNIVSWNLNGIRAAVRKGFLDSLGKISPDILCIQETKAQDDQVKEALNELEGFHIYSNSAIKKGYSGTAILSKEEPLGVNYGIGVEDHDNEGRVIAAEYADFYLVSVYVPNSSSGLKRLPYRTEWDKDFLNYLKNLEEHKPVVVCGDFNVAHQPIDIARPKSNYNKTAGYTQQEIDGMTTFLESGFTDTFRHFNPEEVAYSWWSYRANAREKNIGWRLDYFLVSDSLVSNVEETGIHPDYFESDHCPVSIKLNV
ncbi:exodeoxyribonuclease III [Mangrovivirga cuniculi]|uniref:Exodeoxyribonuclease III n=1 Tax=Mangrovivirga cuniculi TaxID=2715131 RepID=A0A4D7JKB1_9BACT|nr:exodeoxyribonuclease III [Mangrovivirga cuniculi]QCK15137.1 exodeoxyribonuclease III [Mangrovivirga cuniculi]